MLSALTYQLNNKVAGCARSFAYSRTIVHGRRPSRRIPSRFEHGGKLTWKTPEILHFSGLTSKLFRIIPRWKFSNDARIAIIQRNNPIEIRPLRAFNRA